MRRNLQNENISRPFFSVEVSGSAERYFSPQKSQNSMHGAMKGNLLKFSQTREKIGKSGRKFSHPGKRAAGKFSLKTPAKENAGANEV